VNRRAIAAFDARSDAAWFAEAFAVLTPPTAA
jgi:hypothetical protein